MGTTIRECANMGSSLSLASRKSDAAPSPCKPPAPRHGGPSRDLDTLLRRALLLGHSPASYGGTPPRANLAQRMTAFYTKADLTSRINDPSFLAETVSTIVHMREGISEKVKKWVDDYQESDDHSGYKHYVPYKQIIDKLLSDLEGRTRKEIIDHLLKVITTLEVDPPQGLNPEGSAAEFQTWADEAITIICDYPPNIFCWDSSGDAGGTRIDKPINNPSDTLILRLGDAMGLLELALGG